MSEHLNRQEHEDLEAAYRATLYVADCPGAEIRIDQRHPRLDEALGHSDWAYITAWNPHSRTLEDSVNAAAQARLRAILEARALPFFEGCSRPDDGSAGEESFLVCIPKAEAEELGREFEQNAIVVGRSGEPAELCWPFREKESGRSRSPDRSQF